MSLKDYARTEMQLSGMCGEAWNESQLYRLIDELIVAFAACEHSGGSAGATIAILKGIGWEAARSRYEGGRPPHDGPVEAVLVAFANQSYPGGDKGRALAYEVFLHLASWRPLGPGGSTDQSLFRPDVRQAMDVTQYLSPDGETLTVYQSMRDPCVFSEDSGKTWYHLDRPGWSYPPGVPFYRRPGRPGFSS